MSRLTQNEMIVAEYGINLVAGTVTDEIYQNMIKLFMQGVDGAKGWLCQEAAMTLCTDYLDNDEVFWREYNKLNLGHFFLDCEEMRDMREHLRLIHQANMGAGKTQIVPLFKSLLDAIDGYTTMKAETRAGVYQAMLSILFRRNYLKTDVEFTQRLMNNIKQTKDLLYCDFSVLDMVTQGKPYLAE